MPEEAFADLWQTLNAGKPWTGVVKNRRKNGDHYWVLANVTPVLNDGLVSGYMSVRSKPSREQLVAAEAAYQMIRERRAGRWTLREGKLVKASLWGWVDALGRLQLTHRAPALGTLLVLPALAAAALLVAPQRRRLAVYRSRTARRDHHHGLLGYWRFVRKISTVLHSTISKIEALTQGHFEETFEAHGEDEVAQLLRALHLAAHKGGVRAGRQPPCRRREYPGSSRLGCCCRERHGSPMPATKSSTPIRHSLQMLAAREADIRQHLPAFRAEAVIGANIDQFHANAAHQRAMLSGLKGTHRTRLTLGGSKLDQIISPIVDRSGKHVGTVVEWNDRTPGIAHGEGTAGHALRCPRRGSHHPYRPRGKLGYFAVMSRGIKQTSR